MIDCIKGLLAPQYIATLESTLDVIRKQNLFDAAAGAYPATHGERHVCQVLSRVAAIVKEIGLDQFPSDNEITPQECLFELVIATLLHDIAMGAVVAQTEDGDQAQRKVHSEIDRLQCYFQEYGVTKHLQKKNQHHILLIAWCHSSDKHFDARQKLQWIDKEFGSKGGALHLPLCSRILRFADLLDVGPDRLNPIPRNIALRKDQIVHKDKHELISVTFANKRVEMALAEPKPNWQPEVSSEVVAEIRKLEEELEEQLQGLLKWLPGWTVVNKLSLVQCKYETYSTPPENNSPLSGHFNNGGATNGQSVCRSESNVPRKIRWSEWSEPAKPGQITVPPQLETKHRERLVRANDAIGAPSPVRAICLPGIYTCFLEVNDAARRVLDASNEVLDFGYLSVTLVLWATTESQIELKRDPRHSARVHYMGPIVGKHEHRNPWILDLKYAHAVTYEFAVERNGDVTAALRFDKKQAQPRTKDPWQTEVAFRVRKTV